MGCSECENCPVHASGVSSWRSGWQGARWLYEAVGWTCKSSSGGSEGAEQWCSCLHVAEQHKLASPFLAALQRQPRHPDPEDPAQPPDFPEPCSPNRQHPVTNPPKATLPGKRQRQGFKCNPTSCPSFAAVWFWWPPSTLSVAAAAREDSCYLKQKIEAVSVKFVTGNIPERAGPRAMLLDCRDFICNLPAIPGLVFKAGARTRDTWCLILALPKAYAEAWDFSQARQAFPFPSWSLWAPVLPQTFTAPTAAVAVTALSVS